MNPGFKRMIWRTILGSLIVIGGCVGYIRALNAQDFWARQGWLVLVVLGGLLTFSGTRRGSKSN
jgi:uncharacterized membrane protein HdeD (DUF308 family)